MNNSKPRHDDWDPCHPGMIHVAAQDDAVSRRRWLKFIGAGVAVGVVGGGVVASSLMSNDIEKKALTMPPGIACITVLDHLSSFVAGNVSDEDLRKRIFCHIKNCTNCRKKYNSMCCSKTSGSGTRPDKATLKPPCSDHVPMP